jgi:hypothetical protein
LFWNNFGFLYWHTADIMSRNLLNRSPSGHSRCGGPRVGPQRYNQMLRAKRAKVKSARFLPARAS